jgi:Domain of unknown function (DUF4268)
LYIDRGDKEENKAIFDELSSQKTSIENAFGSALTWERLDDARACRIKAEIPGDIFDETQWPGLIEFMTTSMLRMESSFKEPLSQIQRKLRSKSEEP